MIEVVYYDDNVRCYRNGVVERLFKRKGWRIVKNTHNTTAGYNTITIDRQILRHRLISFCWKGLENIVGEMGQDNQIDHIDGNRLNNSVDNLRIVTHQQNQWNRTNAKGCYFMKRDKNWQALIRVNNKDIYLGRFETEADARQAYLIAKQKYHPME
tara:strand:- start:592 stop:1059 length:468 start_codon:yes stop_codon:yes gene_type:complete